jgi:hypothetical protein
MTEMPLRLLENHPIGAVRRWAKTMLGHMMAEIRAAKTADDRFGLAVSRVDVHERLPVSAAGEGSEERRGAADRHQCREAAGPAEKDS